MSEKKSKRKQEVVEDENDTKPEAQEEPKAETAPKKSKKPKKEIDPVEEPEGEKERESKQKAEKSSLPDASSGDHQPEAAEEAQEKPDSAVVVQEEKSEDEIKLSDGKKKRKEKEVVTEEKKPENEVNPSDGKKKRKEKEVVTEEKKPEEEEQDVKKKTKLKAHSVEQSGGSLSTTNLVLPGTDDMEEFANSQRTPRTDGTTPRQRGASASAGTSSATQPAQPSSSSESAAHQPSSIGGDLGDAEAGEVSPEQSDADRQKLQPLARIYINVLELKSIKPANYFVTVGFGTKAQSWVTQSIKKRTTFDEKGRLIAIPKDANKIVVTLWSKGILGDLLNTRIGEAIWNIDEIKDEYPHQPWAKIMKKEKEKCQLRTQIMYLPPGVSLDGDEFITPLHALIRKDKYDLLGRAVDDLFADLSLKDSEGRTPIHLAVEQNKIKYVKLILKKGGEDSKGYVTPKMETALHFAAKFASGEVAKALLKAKFAVNAKADKDMSPLHYAAIANNVEVINVLLDAEGAEIDPKNKDGDTPIVSALTHGSCNAIRVLIERGVNIYEKNDKDLAVWQVAQRKDMVNTEPRKAFMDTLQVHDEREFAHREKLSKKIVVKGEKCALDYEDSTQYILSVKEPTDVAIILTTDDLVGASHFASRAAFALVKSSQGIHKEPAISRDTIQFSGNRSVTIKLEPNSFYFVIPYAKTAEGVREYTLVVRHKKKQEVTITKAKEWAHHIAIEGEWKGETAGGAQPNRTWNDNPKFEITMPKEDNITFMVLLSQEPHDSELRHVQGDDHKKVPYDSNIGFYVCDRGAVKVLGQTDKWTNSRDVHQEFTMDFSERNHLTIIPATHKPGEEGEFTLRLFSDNTSITMEKK